MEQAGQQEEVCTSVFETVFNSFSVVAGLTQYDVVAGFRSQTQSF